MNISQASDLCTGCGICRTLCPVKAVQLQPNEHGFIYPVVDDGICIDCGLCARKCPVLEQPPMSVHTDMFAGYTKDAALLLASSSGAIFPVLAAEILRRGGIVVGAAWDKSFCVEHTAVGTEYELAKLCSSKYVQSYISDACYAQVKSALSEGRFVYFSGTPCQAAALKNYLGREYDTLFIQDVACHSVPSPMVWRNYVAELEVQNGGKLNAFSFRNKASGWEGYYIRAVFENGSVFTQPAVENSYQRGFIKGLFSRNSCFSCKFKGVERCSDITLTDFWGVKGIQPEAYNEQGTSLILLHSDKGRRLFEDCKERLQIYSVVGNSAFAFNQAMLMPIQKPVQYDEFWAAYGKKPFEELVAACCKNTGEEQVRARGKKNLMARIMFRLTR